MVVIGTKCLGAGGGHIHELAWLLGAFDFVLILIFSYMFLGIMGIQEVCGNKKQVD